MLASIPAHSPLLKGYALLGFKVACFHVSSVCLEKRADKFGSCHKGDKHKEYLNYIKRKKRAAGKRECAYWQSCEVHICNFEELYWYRGMNFQKPQKRRRPDRHFHFVDFSDFGLGYGYKKKRKSGQRASCKESFQSMWQSFHTQWWGDHFHEAFAYAYGSPFTTGKTAGRYNTSGCSWKDDDPGKCNAKVEPKSIGSSLDRQKLGLSPSGSLTIEELKKAFRTAALKWHPDRHEHAEKARAEAKFKDCGAAYRSLLNALAKSDQP